MENFQLFRTNILLGGQMKWDLILDSQEDVLIVSDFHLSPISLSSPYNRYSDESLLNYSHSDNIKKFYNNGFGYSKYKSLRLVLDMHIIHYITKHLNVSVHCG